MIQTLDVSFLKAVAVSNIFLDFCTSIVLTI
jgi:hypothetical protein